LANLGLGRRPRLQRPSRTCPVRTISWRDPTSPLFRKDPEKAARQAAAQAEIKRLRALSVDDLAVRLLPGLGGASKGHSLRPQQLCNYLIRDFPDARQLDTLDLLPPVRRALLTLERAGLVSPISLQRSPVWRITDLGETALAEGTVEQRLNKAL
jgi:hypothetical protein